jgi:CxxC-x17-CxxC domain-containing protein
MGNFKFHKKTGSGKGFGRPSYRPSYGGDRENREMFEAVCSSCGKTAMVPFRPNGKKPVFCNACFKKNSPANDGDRPGFVKRTDYGRRPDFEKRPSAPKYNGEMEMINRKIDRLTDMVKTLLAAGNKETKPKAEKKLKNATPVQLPEPLAEA